MSVPIPLKKSEITDPTVGRLVAYRRLLQSLDEQGVPLVSSKDIGDMLAIKPSQVRKDLSYLGEFGKRGVGYNVQRLLSDLSGILAPFHRWRAGLVGLGRLGEALLGYSALTGESYDIVALFDISPQKVGRVVAGRTCYHFNQLASQILEQRLGVLIITVPSSAAQQVVDVAVSTGQIQGLLNFSPTTIAVPDTIDVQYVDISVEMEKLLFRLKFVQQQRQQGGGVVQ